MSDNKQLAVTYVWQGDKAFCVSTIDRESSSTLGGRFSETMVWDWDDKTRERGAWIWQGAGYEGSISTHQKTVERIFATGSPELPEDDA
jgi:hypothetical protein